MSESVSSVERHPISGQSVLEEIVNSLTHGLGVLFGIAASALLVFLAQEHADSQVVIGCSVFGATVVLLYASSTAYHGARNEIWKRRLQTMDHVAIYLLIAGTYTPFALGPMRDHSGALFLVLIWCLAAIGSVLEGAHLVRNKGISIALYLIMGWIAVLAFPVLRLVLPVEALAWLITGGSAYTLGTVFFLWEKLPFSHSIWHIFVLVGTVSHFCAILHFVAPIA